MLTHLSIRDFAIIDTISLDFYQGFHIVTGETGAGKSILIEAISLALGSRADTTLIRSGKTKATVELTLVTTEPLILAMLEENGLEATDTIMISREINTVGKSVCRINGELVSVSFLNRLCKKIADVHGQYDHQSLLDPENHIKLIDSYDSTVIIPLREAVGQLYRSFNETRHQLFALQNGLAERERLQDFKRFELEEIEKAEIRLGEDSDLDQQLQILKNSETIRRVLDETYGHLFDDPESSTDNLGKSLRKLDEIRNYSTVYADITEAVSECYYRLEDLQGEFRKTRDSVAFSPETMEHIIERLELLDRLKRKYGGSLENIVSYRDKLYLDLDEITTKDQRIDQLSALLEQQRDALAVASEALTAARKQASFRLEKEIQRELKELHFKDAELSVSFASLSNSDETVFSENGIDRVEFLMVTNKGEAMKPLAKIASGGEISRIMLAFKCILGDYDRIPTMIFDEIDSGISGITASIVGNKLREISKTHQILCITHLPQIAALSDHHYRIYKENDGDRVTTRVIPLDKKEKVSEIARLLGGIEITETTIRNAEELIGQALV